MARGERQHEGKTTRAKDGDDSTRENDGTRAMARGEDDNVMTRKGVGGVDDGVTSESMGRLEVRTMNRCYRDNKRLTQSN